MDKEGTVNEARDTWVWCIVANPWIRETISCQSVILPGPSSPQASLPDPCGPETRYPNSSCTTARCLGVNRCWYMWVFIAGQMTTGMEGDRARRRDEARVSHSPQAILASKSAEHGATMTRSVQRRNSMCKMGSPTFFQSYGPRLVGAISRHRLS